MSAIYDEMLDYIFNWTRFMTQLIKNVNMIEYGHGQIDLKAKV